MLSIPAAAALAIAAVDTPAAAQSFPIVELRQYTLHPGQRDVLLDLFERQFVESQEALGMKVLGTFRDLDRPDRFVWIRGFADMPSRAEGLTAFYSGPVWKQHREAANATMVDIDNVLLLRPARSDSGFPPARRPRPAPGATEVPPGLLVATIYPLAAPAGAELLDDFTRTAEPALRAAGVTVVASYVTEASPNNFPPLPVREQGRVFAWFAAFADPADYERSREALAGSAAWRDFEARLQRQLAGLPEVLRLQATPRSELRPDAFVPPASSGASDFDFLLGDWTIHHRRLKRRLAGDSEWIEFSGPASARKILGGLGNIDEARIDRPGGGYTGATLRLYNPATRLWTIYWMDSRDPKLDPPMVGSFRDGRGLFFGDDTFEGKPIRVRFIWTPLTATSCRWEQAFSADGGETWETNWIMSFTRRQ